MATLIFVRLVWEDFNKSYRRLLLYPVLLIVTVACSTDHKIELIYKERAVIGISIPVSELDGYSLEGLHTDLRVRLAGSNQDIVGELDVALGVINFFPIWHFTPGLEYVVYWKGENFHSFSFDLPDNPSTELIRIYPTADTLPANLLKIYFEFSAPMEDANSYQFVFLTDANGDTIRDVFLQLKPELWNEDRTILTLWLDPGRIKRDLGPNQEKGVPLIMGESYSLTVDTSWRDQNGMPLSSGMDKRFFVTAQDRVLPATMEWELLLPATATRDTLSIVFNGPMDSQLAREAIVIYYGEARIEGVTYLKKKESQWQFRPSSNWLPGKYTIVVESRFEDLAGNNLNRLFERDLMDESDLASEQSYHEVSFVIR